LLRFARNDGAGDAALIWGAAITVKPKKGKWFGDSNKKNNFYVIKFLEIENPHITR
jgi:hypothetical protein